MRFYSWSVGLNFIVFSNGRGRQRKRQMDRWESKHGGSSYKDIDPTVRSSSCESWLGCGLSPGFYRVVMSGDVASKGWDLVEVVGAVLWEGKLSSLSQNRAWLWLCSLAPCLIMWSPHVIYSATTAVPLTMRSLPRLMPLMPLNLQTCEITKPLFFLLSFRYFIRVMKMDC